MDEAVANNLQTLAEISIALAGFTGIVGAIRTQGGHAFGGPEAFVPWTLLVVSGLVLFAAFVPSTIALHTENPSALWTWSFRCLLVLHAITWLVSVPFMRRSGFHLPHLPQPQRGVGLVFMALGVVAVVVEIGAVFVNPAWRTPFVYQSILLSLLMIAFAVFVMLMVGIQAGASNE